MIQFKHLPLILNIDTATEHASVCISRNKEILALEKSAEQKNHAAFLEPAIKKLCSIAQIELHDIDAVAVSAGPGSYTGLRVGLSSAKAICYALNKPLIFINTLEVMAAAAIDEVNLHYPNFSLPQLFFCPLIDARRMEVFTAIYDHQLKIIVSPHALIINEAFFAIQLQSSKIIFTGNGAGKLQKIIQNANAVFINVQHNAVHLSGLSIKVFIQKKFENIPYAEPLYLKEFYHPQKSNL